MIKLPWRHLCGVLSLTRDAGVVMRSKHPQFQHWSGEDYNDRNDHRSWFQWWCASQRCHHTFRKMWQRLTLCSVFSCPAASPRWSESTLGQIATHRAGGTPGGAIFQTLWTWLVFKGLWDSSFEILHRLVPPFPPFLHFALCIKCYFAWSAILWTLCTKCYFA